jgi:hypothetical protein
MSYRMQTPPEVGYGAASSVGWGPCGGLTGQVSVDPIPVEFHPSRPHETANNVYFWPIPPEIPPIFVKFILFIGGGVDFRRGKY